MGVAWGGLTPRMPEPPHRRKGTRPARSPLLSPEEARVKPLPVWGQGCLSLYTVPGPQQIRAAEWGREVVTQ